MKENCKPCPHCGASLPAEASFCPCCAMDLRPRQDREAGFQLLQHPPHLLRRHQRGRTSAQKHGAHLRAGMILRRHADLLFERRAIRRNGSGVRGSGAEVAVKTFSFTKWKMGEIVPGSGQIEDLSLWKNYVYNSRSIFAWNFEDDFLAGYDHGRDAGIVHVANHHQVNGKKFFLWGNNPSAKVWDKMLSDNDGQYLELMVGAYSDNQPDYSWIYPGTVREFSHIWYPIKGIRGVKNATAEGAVNVEFDKNGKMFIGFNTTTLRKDARVKVFYGDETIFEEVVTLDPNTPYTNIIDVKKFPAQTLFTVSLFSQEGQDLISYTPVRITEAPMPEVVSDVKSPSEYTTIEDLYLTGLRLEQFHNARVLPEPYYLEALARDSTDARVNTAMGIRYLKKGSFDLAGKYLQRAVDKLTRDYTTPKEIEPLYYLALCNELQGRLKEAEDLYWKVTWSTAYQHPAYLALARIAAIEEDYGKALEHIENAVYTGGRNPEAYIMGACFLRKTGRVGEALSLRAG